MERTCTGGWGQGWGRGNLCLSLNHSALLRCQKWLLRRERWKSSGLSVVDAAAAPCDVIASHRRAGGLRWAC